MSEQVQAETGATVEVTETPSVSGEVTSKPTRDEVINNRGWSAEEADKAEKFGMLSKPEEKKPEPVQEKKVEEVKPEPKKRMADHEFEMSPEQEEAFHKIFPAGTKPSAFFTGMKIEKLKRQQAAREAEALRQENAAVKAKLEAYEKSQAKVQPLVDENGNQIDPDEQPLTMKQIKEMQRQAQEEQKRQEEEIRNRSTAAAQAHQEQEEMARQAFPDFDDALKSAGELAQKLDELVDDPVEQKYVRKLMADFQHAVANADKLGPNDLNAAELAYKLGKLNPNFGKQTANGNKADNGISPASDPTKKGDGGLTPEQLKRLEKTTQRRASSASIPGGSGKKAVAPEEVTVDQLNRMPVEQRKRFREKFPDHYSKLLRG